MYMFVYISVEYYCCCFYDEDDLIDAVVVIAADVDVIAPIIT